MNVQPYLSFEGRAQEAIDFYKTALGAKTRRPRCRPTCRTRTR